MQKCAHVFTTARYMRLDVKSVMNPFKDKRQLQVR
jgi:hypothetical protein